MPRIARLVVSGEPAVYHVMSRTALPEFVLGDVEKEFLCDLIRKLSLVYFSEVLGFCIMGNHFHLVVRMHPGEEFDDEDIRKRFARYYGKDASDDLSIENIVAFREKWASISEYMKEVKQSFSRFYNRRHDRKGYFWSDRFKSVLVENGETLINCLAYVDLNAVRAGICDKPEQHRWCSLGYHVQRNNEGKYLSLDFGLREFGLKGYRQRLAHYRRFVYEKGGLLPQPDSRVEGLPVDTVDRFLLNR